MKTIRAVPRRCKGCGARFNATVPARGRAALYCSRQCNDRARAKRFRTRMAKLRAKFDREE